LVLVQIAVPKNSGKNIRPNQQTEKLAPL
jgi:hypothetical protein